MTQPVRHEDKSTSDSAFYAAPVAVSEILKHQDEPAVPSASGGACAGTVSSELQLLQCAVREAVGEQNYQHWFHK